MKTYINRLKLEKKIITIHPGDIVTATENTVISTLLGSCIAVCLRDENRNVCGMNHFLLPGYEKANDDFSVHAAGRYGISSMETLINKMLHEGATKSKLVAKIFGGATILSNFSQNVGQKNIEFVRWFMNNEKIPIIGEDVGGTDARKIYFFTKDGAVLVENISKRSTELIQEEENYFERAKKLLNRNDVTIF